MSLALALLKFSGFDNGKTKTINRRGSSLKLKDNRTKLLNEIETNDIIANDNRETETIVIDE